MGKNQRIECKIQPINCHDKTAADNHATSCEWACLPPGKPPRWRQHVACITFPCCHLHPQHAFIEVLFPTSYLDAYITKHYVHCLGLCLSYPVCSELSLSHFYHMMFLVVLKHHCLPNMSKSTACCEIACLTFSICIVFGSCFWPLPLTLQRTRF